MKPHRKEKIRSLIQEELSKIIERELEFDKAIVTITAVEISQDLLQAKIGVGVFPDEKAIEIFELLDKKRRNFQHQLLKKLNLKPMPRLKFEIEKSA